MPRAFSIDEESIMTKYERKKNESKIKVAIIGASGYAGGELLRLLLRHPEVEVEPVLATGQVATVKPLECSCAIGDETGIGCF